MSTTPYQNLAQQFLDLWQKQIGSVMSDKQFIQAMLGTLKTMQDPQAYAKAATASKSADATDARHGDMANLAFRLSQCERRLAELEKRRKPEPAAKSRKPRSKKPRK